MTLQLAMFKTAFVKCAVLSNAIGLAGNLLWFQHSWLPAHGLGIHRLGQMPSPPKPVTGTASVRFIHSFTVEQVASPSTSVTGTASVHFIHSTAIAQLPN